ncbi:hypothetical protein ZIOFF_040592 [Zingiber officinale]|uniref:40S ribosomal protein SA n=1 Tax=Zingiber officinale TaxID=94328 RepID=A0A8J5L157_ZINOF|nr:hypothetical protein ZIOFF_040592 [Zingiber officinale]
MAATKVLSQREQDIQMMLAADVHLGTKNCDFQMERYVYKRRTDGIFIINLGKTWEKLQLAARVIVAIENPQDIIVQSARPYGQTAPIKESALGNIPTIAFCDTDSPMRYVDIGIPANNKGKLSIGCLYWLLARMVLQMRGTIAHGRKWEVMVDLFFYRDPEEAKEQEEVEAPVAPEFGAVAEYTGMVPTDQWPTQQWAPEIAAATAVPSVPGVEWTANQGAVVADGWDSAAAPAVEVPSAAPPAVWEPAQIAPSGWE